MKITTIRFALVGSLVLSASLFSQTQPPHLEYEMSSYEYRSLIESQEFLDSDSGRSFASRAEKAGLSAVMNAGKRLLNWVDTINKSRPAGNKLSLSTKENQAATPIEQEAHNNPTLVLAAFDAFKATAPAWFSTVVFSGEPLVASPNVSDEVYRSVGRPLDIIYQRASRWLLQEPYLFFYSQRKKLDVRGYYFLTRYPELQKTFSDWATLEETEKRKLRLWMINLCHNGSSSESSCRAQVTSAETKENALWDLYQKHLPRAQAAWDANFHITEKRSDVDFSHEDLLSIPFRTPEELAVQHFLSDNIEDEWQFGSWQLKLNFTTSGFNLPHIRFVAGATPNVNGLAGSTITMDANKPLDEYEVQWTIRHEFGHVLGFPDCYVEFYDDANERMVSYQLDITNLMCSRRGVLQEKHVEELRRAYH